MLDFIIVEQTYVLHAIINAIRVPEQVLQTVFLVLVLITDTKRAVHAHVWLLLQTLLHQYAHLVITLALYVLESIQTNAVIVQVIKTESLVAETPALAFHLMLIKDRQCALLNAIKVVQLAQVLIVTNVLHVPVENLEL